MTQHSDPIVKWVDISPELAEEWLGKNHGNRNQRPGTIAIYVRDMEAGNWLTTGDPVRFDTDGRMIDGQHRLEAIVGSGRTIRMLVITGLDRRVQGVLDGNVRRSARDALKFSGITDYVNVLPAIARISRAWDQGRLVTAASTMSVESQMTNTEVVQWVEDNPDSHDAASIALGMYKDLHATPSPLAYAIMRTYRIDADAASEFWLSIAEMRTNGSGDPRYTLIRTLERMAGVGRAKLPATQLSLLFRAWNAWRDGREITKLPMETAQGGATRGVSMSEPK